MYRFERTFTPYFFDDYFVRLFAGTNECNVVHTHSFKFVAENYKKDDQIMLDAAHFSNITTNELLNYLRLALM